MKFIYIKTPVALILFLVQYLSLACLLFSGPLYPGEWYLWPFYVSGLFLGFWSLHTMGKGNLNAAPDILPGARIVMSGPYVLIRHPMYAAIILVFIPLVLTQPLAIRILIMSILFINLLLKITYEERRLRESFRQYSAYSSRTWRLLPFVY
jgi:protein-S-isoprenylcysteine O-methyltransferase Ste14